MILSASRRTDIPAFYAEWFANRVKEGFLLVRNPMNIHQVSKITLSPNVVDCIVFWTKNAKPMMKYLCELSSYNYYFQYTITSYDDKMEVLVPKKNIVIDNFKALSDKIGRDHMVWRYDPIISTYKYGMSYHIEYFEKIAKKLEGYTKRCVISFLDLYKKTERNLDSQAIEMPTDSEMRVLSKQLADIAKRYGMTIQSCSEKIDLGDVGIEHGCCVDRDLISGICGYSILAKKDKNQRDECCCIESIDIGEYNSCMHQCAYCYATYNRTQALKKHERHNPQSPLLIGELQPDDIVKERKVKSLRENTLFNL